MIRALVYMDGDIRLHMYASVFIDVCERIIVYIK